MYVPQCVCGACVCVHLAAVFQGEFQGCCLPGQVYCLHVHGATHGGGEGAAADLLSSEGMDFGATRALPWTTACVPVSGSDIWTIQRALHTITPPVQTLLAPSLPSLPPSPGPGAPAGCHLQVSPAGYNLTTVKVDSTVFVSPKRSWLLPPSLLLPDIPIRATIKLGVRGPLESGMVRCPGAFVGVRG